jgi:hypothetical protein
MVYNKRSLKNLYIRTNNGTCILELDGIVIHCYDKGAKYQTSY